MARGVVLLVAIAAILPASLAAQRIRPHAKVQPLPPDHTGIVRGVILRQDSVTPAAYASVEVLGGDVRRLSNDAGEFSFRLAPGRYHLRARQIGFAPRDTIVDVADGAISAVVVIRLTPVTIRLADVTVRKPQRCTKPGVDSTDEPVLYGIVAAVRENALREMLLRRTYPFEYVVMDVQRTAPEGGGAPARSTLDTLGYRSDAVAPYRVGATVFTDHSDPRGAWERMRLPATTDFADAAFIANHCFDYGVDDVGNYELRFEPLASLAVPDVEGSVTLDTTTFVIHAADIRLTRSADVAHGFQRLSVKVRYAELAPRVAVPIEIAATQAYHTPDPGAPPYIATEVQSIRFMRFLRGVPPGARREQQFAASSGAARGTSPPVAAAR